MLWYYKFFKELHRHLCLRMEQAIQSEWAGTVSSRFWGV